MAAGSGGSADRVTQPHAPPPTSAPTPPGLLDLVVRPLGWALALPAAAAAATASVWHTARTLQQLVAEAAELMPRLVLATRRVEQLLDVLEPPALRLGAQLDDRLVDDLVRSARAVPGLVLAVNDALAGFEVFVDRADGVRDRIDDLTSQAGRIAGQVGAVLSTVDLLTGRAGDTVSSAGETATRADRLTGYLDDLAARAERALQGAESIVVDGQGIATLAGSVAGQARDLAGIADGLVKRAEPVIDLTVDLGEQAAEPARTLLQVAASNAPAFASVAPSLVGALGELADRLPDLLRRLDTDVLPTLHALQTTPGDVRALKETVEDIEPKLGEMEAELAGIPGAKLLRRRGRRTDPGT